MTTCAYCGFTFDPEKNPGCGSCPLHTGCTIACCPNCGISNIQPEHSRLANWLQKLLPGGKPHAKHPSLAKRASD